MYTLHRSQTIFSLMIWIHNSPTSYWLDENIWKTSAFQDIVVGFFLFLVVSVELNIEMLRVQILACWTIVVNHRQCMVDLLIYQKPVLLMLWYVVWQSNNTYFFEGLGVGFVSPHTIDSMTTTALEMALTWVERNKLYKIETDVNWEILWSDDLYKKIKLWIRVTKKIKTHFPLPTLCHENRWDRTTSFLLTLELIQYDIIVQEFVVILLFNMPYKGK